MEPSPLDNRPMPNEHEHEARVRVLEVKASLQDQKMEDGMSALRELMVQNTALLRAELAKNFVEEAAARAELELRLVKAIQQTGDRLEAKFDAQFRLLLRAQLATIALVLGLAARMMWP